jgi:SnoaL-like domain
MQSSPVAAMAVNVVTKKFKFPKVNRENVFMSIDSQTADHQHEVQAIRQTIENWAIWRDAGDWERFATVWHPSGVMNATWFQGHYADFIKVTQEGWAKGVSILHFLGGCSVDLNGERAVAQTKMTISQRGMVEGIDGPVLCDVVCTGRFYDFMAKHEGQWKVLVRQPIYEKDRLDTVDPSAQLRLDTQALAGFPEGYRHLAYIQTRIGYKVKMDMPMLKGDEVQKLYARGKTWLANGTL